MYISIPTYKDNNWVENTEFPTKKDFLDFLLQLFKEPGKYEFDETSEVFNEQAREFNKNKFYCKAPRGTKDFIDYWDREKEKCRNGVIYINGKKTWYIPREYYMWLNFLPIYNKEIKKFGFAEVRDAQYHMALYERIAEMSNKHAAILKKRQIASSYFHLAKIINLLWFEEGAVCKMAGSLKDYVNEKGSWRFAEEYRNFLNSYTAWYRPFNPDKILNWEQKIEVTQNGRKKDVGLKSVFMGLVLEKDPTNGVGGPCSFFFHEEAGIAPKMSDTAEYLRPALKSGLEYTGFAAYAGSVGDLEQCEPLKQMILNPAGDDILAVETDLFDETGQLKHCGLFIPEHWSMPPFIDKYGNSKAEEAKEHILAARKIWKKELPPEKYQLRISQGPITISEAFAYRKESVFPLHLISAQTRRIEDKEYYLEYVDIVRDESGSLVAKNTKKTPIREFPISPKTEDKTGAIVIHERPIKDAPFDTYYASVDPVSEGKTRTSDSLCSIYVYRTKLEKRTINPDGTYSVVMEHDKLVAWWCGRFDDINKTHERLENIIEFYGARTIVENNVSLFIQYMISRRKQKYLIPKSEIVFLKEIGSNKTVYQEYGWKNTGTIFKQHLLSYGVQFLTEEIDVETDSNGNITKTFYGVERIADEMLLKEMGAYEGTINVDRLVAYCALIAFATLQASNRGYPVLTIQEKSLQQGKNNNNLYMNIFSNIGKAPTQGKKSIKKPFKNFR